MIASLFTVPIIFEQRHVEIKALNRCLSVPNHFDGTFTETNRRKSRRTGEALLGTAIGNINTTGIQVYRLSAKSGYTVCEKECPVFVGNLNCFRQGLEDTSRGFPMHECNQFRIGNLHDSFGNFFNRYVFTPFCFHRCHRRAAPRSDISDPAAKVAVDAYDY